jgi:hypothetical protein
VSGTLLTYGAFSDYLEKALLHHVFGATAYTRPAGLWVALYTTPSTDAAPGNEVLPAVGYARVAVTFVDAPDQLDGSSALWNSGVLQFPVATADWGIVTHCGVHDAATAGNMLASGQLATQKQVDLGDAVRFAANQFMIALQ